MLHAALGRAVLVESSLNQAAITDLTWLTLLEPVKQPSAWPKDEKRVKKAEPFGVNGAVVLK